MVQAHFVDSFISNKKNLFLRIILLKKIKKAMGVRPSYIVIKNTSLSVKFPTLALRPANDLNTFMDYVRTIWKNKEFNKTPIISPVFFNSPDQFVSRASLTLELAILFLPNRQSYESRIIPLCYFLTTPRMSYEFRLKPS